MTPLTQTDINRIESYMAARGWEYEVVIRRRLGLREEITVSVTVWSRKSSCRRVGPDNMISELVRDDQTADQALLAVWRRIMRALEACKFDKELCLFLYSEAPRQFCCGCGRLRPVA